MTIYVITNSDNTVLRREVSNTTPELRGGEIATASTVTFPGWPTISGRVLKYSNGVYSEIDTRSLDELKADKNTEINKARLAANKTSFTFSGKQIACDDLSRSDIEGVNGIVCLTGALPGSFPGAWKAVDNSYVPIPNRDVWMSFYGAMVNKGIINFNYAQSLKTQLTAATTHDQVNAITWGDGP